MLQAPRHHFSKLVKNRQQNFIKSRQKLSKVVKTRQQTRSSLHASSRSPSKFVSKTLKTVPARRHSKPSKSPVLRFLKLVKSRRNSSEAVESCQNARCCRHFKSLILLTKSCRNLSIVIQTLSQVNQHQKSGFCSNSNSCSCRQGLQILLPSFQNQSKLVNKRSSQKTVPLAVRRPPKRQNLSRASSFK